MHSILKHKFSLLLTAGLLIEICFIDFTVNQNKERAILDYILVYSVTSIIVFSVYYLLKNKFVSLSKRNEVYLIIIFAVLFRLTLFPTALSSSDDAYRYVWEGKLVLNGINPFEVPPDDESLRGLHSEDYPDKVSFPKMTTIYPPVSQLIFALAYVIGGESFVSLKIIYLIAEIAIILLIIQLLRLYGKDERSVILYAWLPLPVMEFFINAHIDVIGIMFFMLFIYFFVKGKTYLSAFPFALAFLSKLFPLFFLLLIFKNLYWKKFTGFFLIAGIIIVLSFVPFIPSSGGLENSLSTYLSKWSFNGSVYKILYSIVDDNSTSRLILLSLFGTSVIWLSFRKDDFIKSVYLIWIAYIIFTPTLYPWYLTWISALNPLFSFASVNSLLFTINVSNFTPLSNEWTEYWWGVLIQYIPFYSLLIYDYLKNRVSNAVKKTESS